MGKKKNHLGKKHQYFRAAAGAVVQGPDGRVLAFERTGEPGAWQFPQGGLECAETPEEAVRRELLEETGIPTEAVEMVESYPEWLAYELPEPLRNGKKGRGQVLKWYRFQFLGTESDIDLEGAWANEFRAWKWTTIRQLAEETVPFRRAIYRRLAAAWNEAPPTASW